jgi:penicillin-binding protein 1C
MARFRQAGVSPTLPVNEAPGLAIGLGGVGITLRDLVQLYAGLANGGKTHPLRDGTEAVPVTDSATAILDASATWQIADILSGVRPPEGALHRAIAYKTGTSYGYRDAWAVGFDRATTIGVWVGRPDNGAVPGLVGRAVAAPILFDAFARLGGATDFVEKPAMALVATTSSLPPPLRHLRKDVPKTLAATVQAPLKITFPLDGSRLDLGLTAGPPDPQTALVMKAAGGVPPLTWLVNGAPVGRPNVRRQAAWTPDGAGFVRLSVMDARGTTDSVVVRVE